MSYIFKYNIFFFLNYGDKNVFKMKSFCFYGLVSLMNINNYFELSDIVIFQSYFSDQRKSNVLFNLFFLYFYRKKNQKFNFFVIMFKITVKKIRVRIFFINYVNEFRVYNCLEIFNFFFDMLVCFFVIF